MSCANTPSASINHAKLVPNPKRPWLRLFVRLTVFSRYFARRSTRRELLALNDHLLADIGLSKHDTSEDAVKSSRTCMTMWHVHR
jgi:uncharacterized protein YjiS (DUF1127 family)